MIILIAMTIFIIVCIIALVLIVMFGVYNEIYDKSVINELQTIKGNGIKCPTCKFVCKRGEMRARCLFTNEMLVDIKETCDNYREVLTFLKWLAVVIKKVTG